MTVVPIGSIRHPERARQLHDFQHLKIGTITPTDIDGFIDYHAKAFVFFEIKTIGVELGYGQRTALERLVDAVVKADIKSVLFVAEHACQPRETVNAADCQVRSMYYAHQWTSPSQSYTLREIVRRFLKLPEDDTYTTLITKAQRDQPVSYAGLGNVIDLQHERVEAPSVDQIKW